MSTVTIPFAAQAAELPCLVTTSVDGVSWNAERQLNEQSDGTPWHTLPQAASTTDTNLDGQGDDVQDPYYASAS